MALADDLERVAAAAGAYGPVTGVLAAEPASQPRSYLVALGEDDRRAWLVLDEAGGRVEDRALVREVASIVVLCELAAELAGGGDVGELRRGLAEVRASEQLEGIEAAEAAAGALEQAVGEAPRVASPAYLDAVGTAARRLEGSLGEHGSPFANAVAASSAAVDEFVREVEARYAGPLR
jgi:hypothetical protein